MFLRRLNRRAHLATARPLIKVVVCLMLLLCAVSVRAGDKEHKKAERALRSGEFEVAEKLFRELVAKDAGDAQARLGLSYTLLKRRNLQEAAEQAAYVIGRDEYSARAHALLGAALLASGEFQLALRELSRSLSLDENEALAVSGLAQIDFYEGRVESSLRGLRRAVFLESQEPDFIFNLAQVAARAEHFAEAANAYEKFLSIAPHADADRRANIRGMIDFMRYLGKQSKLYVESSAPRVVVPFELMENLPVIQVRLNGSKEPLRFILDSGSSMCVISEATAKKVGLEEIARGGTARAVGGGGRFQIVYGFLSSIEIGDVRVENVPVFMRPFFNGGGTQPIDGYIGLSVIKKYVATVDYGALTLTLIRQRDNSSAAKTPDSLEVPIRTTSSGFLSGEVRLRGFNQPFNFIVDTGASISVVDKSVAASDEMNRFAQDVKVKIYGAAGVAEDVKMLLLPRVEFGSHARDGIRAVVLDLNVINETTGFLQDGIIGGNFLANFRLTFDFRRGVIRLEPLRSSLKEATSTPK